MSRVARLRDSREGVDDSQSIVTDIAAFARELMTGLTPANPATPAANPSPHAPAKGSG
jgi:hypothetical protein